MRVFMKLGAPLAMAAIVAMLPAAAEEIVLHDGTPVRLRVNRNLSSADSRTGDTVDFEVLDDVKVGDATVIARNAVALGAITEAKPKGRMGKGGKLNVMIDYVRTVTDDKVALRGVRETAGAGKGGAMTGAVVATALIAWPAAPLFLLMHGKDITIPKGTEITAYVNGEIKIDPEKLAKAKK